MKRLLVLALASTALFANAQTYPGSKPVSIVVPFAAGGPTDRVARDLAEAMRKNMPGSNFVVENVNGAGGTIGATKVAKANPDGHTLLLFHIGMASTPALYRKLQYKPLEDFEYLGLVNEVPMTLIGKPQLPANTYRDFENYIKANSGKLNIAHAGLGSASHLCGLMWQSAINAKEAMTTIPFGGTGPAMNALVGGQVDLMCDQTTNTTNQIKEGKIKGFAVTTKSKVSSLPDLPTLDAGAVKGFEASAWHALWAPKGLPKDATDKLVAALQAALKDPKVIERFASLGTEPVAADLATPAALKAHLTAEVPRWGAVIKAAGAKGN